MDIPRSKNTGERGHKHMNILRSKNTKGSINETLHSHLRCYKKSTVKEYINQGGLAATFDLAAFLVSMIAPVKKSVNHLRTVTSMRTTRK